MIQKYKDTMELVCDKCGDNRPPYDEDQFNDMISDAKGDGHLQILGHADGEGVQAGELRLQLPEQSVKAAKTFA